MEITAPSDLISYSLSSSQSASIALHMLLVKEELKNGKAEWHERLQGELLLKSLLDWLWSANMSGMFISSFSPQAGSTCSAFWSQNVLSLCWDSNNQTLQIFLCKASASWAPNFTNLTQSLYISIRCCPLEIQTASKSYGTFSYFICCPFFIVSYISIHIFLFLKSFSLLLLW